MLLGPPTAFSIARSSEMTSLGRHGVRGEGGREGGRREGGREERREGGREERREGGRKVMKKVRKRLCTCTCPPDCGVKGGGGTLKISSPIKGKERAGKTLHV